MKKLSLDDVCSEINGVLCWGIMRFGMRLMIVSDDVKDIVKRYWVMIHSEKIMNGMPVKAGDPLGWQGRMPKVIMIGAPRVIFPKTVEYLSGETVIIESCFFVADGKYYIGRLCSLLLLLDGYNFGSKYILTQETVELDFYMADGSMIHGRNIENITSLYGFRENEIPDFVEEGVNLWKWLEEMRMNNKIK